MNFLDENAAALKAFAEFSAALGARPDYVQGGGGNTSAKLDGQKMAIKASGFCLSDITPSNAYAVLDYDQLSRFYLQNEASALADVEAAGSAAARAAVLPAEGVPALRPSVEAGFHSLLERYVAHTHSVYANLACCCQQWETVLAEIFGDGEMGYAAIPYVDPGARLTFAVRDALRNSQNPPLIFLLNHGLVAHAGTSQDCLALHEQANQKLAAYFQVKMQDYPQARLQQTAENRFESATPWLQDRLRSQQYTDEMLLNMPLYPDQMVFFQGTLGTQAVIDRQNGRVAYQMGQKAAQAIEETLVAVLFILETLKLRGLTPRAMGESAKAFIGSWESEKYRKALADKRH